MPPPQVGTHAPCQQTCCRPATAAAAAAAASAAGARGCSPGSGLPLPGGMDADSLALTALTRAVAYSHPRPIPSAASELPASSPACPAAGDATRRLADATVRGRAAPRECGEGFRMVVVPRRLRGPSAAPVAAADGAGSGLPPPPPPSSPCPYRTLTRYAGECAASAAPATAVIRRCLGEPPASPSPWSCAPAVAAAARTSPPWVSHMDGCGGGDGDGGFDSGRALAKTWTPKSAAPGSKPMGRWNCDSPCGGRYLCGVGGGAGARVGVITGSVKRGIAGTTPACHASQVLAL